MDDCQTIRQSLVDDESNAVRLDGCSIVGSITTADNPPAQRLYNSRATKTSWLTYDRSCQ